MKLSGDAEEVLEKMWICTMESGMDSVAIGDFGLEITSPEVKELLESGHIITASQSDSHIALTDFGQPDARNVVRRHRLAERLLADVLNTKDACIHKSACEFEHILHCGIDENVCTLLGHPKFCPHGKPIPEGECCKKAKTEIIRAVAALSALEPEQRGKIAYLEMRDHEELQKLMAMGVLPGMPVVLVQAYPSYVFEIDQTRYAVDKEIAECIQVRIGG